MRIMFLAIVAIVKSLATYSGVELAVQNQHAASFIRQQETRYARCAGAVSSCWGGSWGVVLKYAPKQRLTHDFQLMTCVSTSGWLPLYALPFCHAGSERVGRV